MVQHVKSAILAVDGQELSVMQRNLVAKAFKNSISQRRESWRILVNVEQTERAQGNEHKANMARNYAKNVENELFKVCNSFIKLLKDTLIVSASSVEGRAFWMKMVGDYYRYITEFTKGERCSHATEQARDAYSEGIDVASELLSPAHPVRLGLMLNCAVFHYEVLYSLDEACNLAKAAFEDATADLYHIDDEFVEDATTLMQLLRENIDNWDPDGRILGRK